MKLNASCLILLVASCTAFAQEAATPVPSGEVFTAEQIGHALAPPTPNAGRTVASDANAPKDDGRRTMPSKNFAATRFSSLNEITPQTVGKLEPVITFSLAVNKGQEAAPIVADNTMYVVTAYPNIVYALDLTKPGAPLKWRFSPQPIPASQGVACCDFVNRGGTLSHGRYQSAHLQTVVSAKRLLGSGHPGAPVVWAGDSQHP